MEAILPPIRSRCKFTPEELTYHMDRNLEQQLPDLYALQGEYSGTVLVIAGGPSVDSQWDTIERIQGPVLTISRMAPVCEHRSIVPDFVVAMDSSKDQLDGFRETYPKTAYLLSTVTNADAVAKVVADGRSAYVFDSFTDEEVRRKRVAAGYRVATALAAGGSVAVAAVAAAMTLGYSDLHIFGFDCCVPDPDYHHAEGIAGPSSPEQFFTIEVAGNTYVTSCPYIEFANQTAELLGNGKRAGLLRSAKIYGHSLINAIWRDDANS